LLQNLDIDQNLMYIISKYKEESEDNEELADYLDRIRFALELGKENTEGKSKTLRDFNKYNNKRLLLDKNINQRIDTLNDLLPTLTPNSTCSEFYLKQRKILKESGNLSNAEKKSKLTENSVSCPTDDDEGEYYYFYW
ncbi:hypothetical protein KR032_003350, partial [Drosophila birchii]